MNSNIVVYTSITAGFENMRSDVLVFGSYDRFRSDRLNAKIYKVLPHLFFDADISVWLDGNVKFAPGVDVESFVEKFLGVYDMALFRHSWRKCAYEEMKAVEDCNLDFIEVLTEQSLTYKSKQFPKDYGLWECGMIIRRHTDVVKEFNEAWWAQISRFSSRDQISFPYVLWEQRRKNNAPFIRTHQGNVRSDERFIYTQRNSSKP